MSQYVTTENEQLRLTLTPEIEPEPLRITVQLDATLGQAVELELHAGEDAATAVRAFCRHHRLKGDTARDVQLTVDRAVNMLRVTRGAAAAAAFPTAGRPRVARGASPSASGRVDLPSEAGGGTSSSALPTSTSVPPGDAVDSSSGWATNFEAEFGDSSDEEAEAAEGDDSFASRPSPTGRPGPWAGLAAATATAEPSWNASFRVGACPVSLHVVGGPLPLFWHLPPAPPLCPPARPPDR